MTMQTTNQTDQTITETDVQPKSNKPNWVVKAPIIRGQQSRLEQIGVAWNRKDGGIGLRPTGKQLIDGDIYLYPITDADETGGAA